MARQINGYQQVRVTVTREGERITVLICAKPPGAEWSKRHIVSSERFRMSDPPETLAAALTLLGQAALAHADTVTP